MTKPALIDRIVVFLIALGQLAFSGLLLFMEFGVAYGGGFRPLFTPYLLCGFVNAWFVFSARPGPRTIAIVWQLIFIVIVSVNQGDLDNPSNRALYVAAFCMLISVTYLGSSTWRTAPTSKSSPTPAQLNKIPTDQPPQS
jgi:hypothetical protein